MVDMDLSKNARERGAQLLGHFESIRTEFPDKIKEIRGKGLLTAFEMFDEPHLDGHTVSVELLQSGYMQKKHTTLQSE